MGGLPIEVRNFGLREIFFVLRELEFVFFVFEFGWITGDIHRYQICGKLAVFKPRKLTSSFESF